MMTYSFLSQLESRVADTAAAISVSSLAFVLECLCIILDDFKCGKLVKC